MADPTQSSTTTTDFHFPYTFPKDPPKSGEEEANKRAIETVKLIGKTWDAYLNYEGVNNVLILTHFF